MKISDILRKIADGIESGEQGGEETNRPENSLQHAELGPVGVDFDSNDMKDEEGDGTAMVSPLQQKLEILKKIAGGVDQPDELTDIKRLTGIQTVIHADDSDLDGQ